MIDAFIFNDELDVLDLRLGQLNDVVDHFVIVESDKTFMGRPKSLYLRDNFSRFSKYHNKIHRIEVSRPPCGSWDAEKHQRTAVMDGVRALGLPKDTTLTFSDCDEIPDPKVIAQYSPELGLRNLKQLTFYYNFNHLMNYGDRSWSRARIGTVQDLYEVGTDGFRGGPRDMDPTFPSLENGGWHCSYFSANLERIRNKVNSISHDDMAPIVNRKPDRQLITDIVNGVDLFNRQGIGDATWMADDDQRLPFFFLANKNKFQAFTNAYFVETYKEILK